MLITSRVSCLILAVLLSATAASAQDAAQKTPPPRPPATNQILLDVVVSPKSGPPVADLQQQDFTLLDNKSPQPITSFKVIPGREAPADILIVIDAVNVDYRILSFQRDQISKFLRAEGGHLAYPIALAVFTDKGVQIVGNFSSDGNELSATLNREDIGLRDIGRSGGFYGASERLQLSLQAFRQLTASEARNPGRKIMLWVSPGWPLLSGARVEIDAKQQTQIFADIVGLNTQLLQAGVTVYNVNPLGSNSANPARSPPEISASKSSPFKAAVSFSITTTMSPRSCKNAFPMSRHTTKSPSPPPLPNAPTNITTWKLSSTNQASRRALVRATTRNPHLTTEEFAPKSPAVVLRSEATTDLSASSSSLVYPCGSVANPLPWIFSTPLSPRPPR
jgi:VWFA-related protein